MIDATQSSDPDGSISSLTITQSSGPGARLLGEAPLRRFRFSAPRIVGAGADTMRFTLRATDNGGVVSTRDVTVAVQGLADGPGELIAVYDPPLKLVHGNITAPDELPNGDDGILATQTVGGRTRIIFIGGGGADYAQRSDSTFDGDFPDVSLVHRRTLSVSTSSPGFPSGADYSVLSETEDAFHWFGRQANSGGAGGRYVEGSMMTIQDPCSVVGRIGYPQDRIWIGQRSGLSVVGVTQATVAPQSFRLDGVLGQLRNGRALCQLLPTRLDTPTPAPAPKRPDISRPEFIALDYNSNEIVLLREVAGDSTYEVFRTIPLETQASTPMRIVSAFARGGPSLVPRYLVVLMTDGRHIGNHRLIIVSQQSQSPDLRQQVLSWSEGVPAAVLEGQFKNVEFPRDLVVVTSSSSRAMHFSGTAPDSGTAFTYGPPSYFEIGLGAGSAVTAWNGSSSTHRTAFLVSYPETGALRYFDLGAP
ncbi:MAG: hypothetical protein JNJ73_18875 [Hyphomonadaceae bacterium]|nr:hypothetical protein [Hyphomonadaceae bacterium]